MRWNKLGHLVLTDLITCYQYTKNTAKILLTTSLLVATPVLMLYEQECREWEQRRYMISLQEMNRN